MTDGILLLNKPASWTSHDLVDAVRKRLGTKRVGHAGTLDPMATGLMILLVGKDTKRSAEFMGLDKSYRGSFRLGVRTDSWDLQGRILEERSAEKILEEHAALIFRSLEGAQEMTPPVFSAIKQGGKKSYDMARRGEAVALAPRPVTIQRFKLEAFESPEIYFDLSCSKGTYVRSLAHLVGEKLGCGAALSSLVRTRIGPYHLKDAKSIEELS